MVATAKQAMVAGEISDLRELVLSQIHQTKETSEARIEVAADQGVVTLTGSVKSKSERIAVETIAKQVRGVTAVANDLTVPPQADRSSTQLAKDLLRAIRAHMFLATEDIRVIVRDRYVTLEGTVHRQLQKMLAEAQIKRLPGIFGISNQIEVTLEAPIRTQNEMNGDAASSNGSAWLETGDAEAG